MAVMWVVQSADSMVFQKAGGMVELMAVDLVALLAGLKAGRMVD